MPVENLAAEGTRCQEGCTVSVFPWSTLFLYIPEPKCIAMGESLCKNMCAEKRKRASNKSGNQNFTEPLLPLSQTLKFLKLFSSTGLRLPTIFANRRI